MAQICITVLLPVVLLLFPFISFAGTGILEIHSEPSGARISIDDVEAGTTPYQNLEALTGKHMVKAVLSPEYPPQFQEVVIDERSPQVIMFKFVERGRGTFIGQEIVSTTWKYKGSVTFASIPTGALVLINGQRLKKAAPIGYADVEVGRYTVEFVLEGRTLRTDFNVIQGETIKLIGDFAAGKVIDKSGKASLQEAEKREEAKQEETKPKESALVQQAPHTLPVVPPRSIQPRTKAPEGLPPYGELVILMNLRREANLKFSDLFDISFPKLPIESISGPLFPKASTIDNSRFKDNFEYRNDANSDTRQFTARVEFNSRDTGPMEGQAKSSIMTIEEGIYDLTVTRRRMTDSFYSVQRLIDATARETIEIVRGNRLIVQIESHMDAENKLNYNVKRTYEDISKKKTFTREPAAEEASRTSTHTPLP